MKGYEFFIASPDTLKPVIHNEPACEALLKYLDETSKGLNEALNKFAVASLTDATAKEEAVVLLGARMAIDSVAAKIKHMIK